MKDRAWPTQGPESGSMWREPRVVEERGRGRQDRALTHAGCKPEEFRLHLMCSDTGRFKFLSAHSVEWMR